VLARFRDEMRQKGERPADRAAGLTLEFAR
jgi:hypothetical protein